MSSSIVPVPYRHPIAERGGDDIKARRVTDPWYKWFTFINDQVQAALSQTTDPFSFDFSAEDFWNNAGGPGAGSWDVIDSEAQHPGIQLLVTDINNGDVTSSWTPTAADGGVLRWDAMTTSRFCFKIPPTITSCAFEVGLSSDARANWPTATFDYASDMIYLSYNSSTSADVIAKVTVGGVAVLSQSVGPCVADTWIDVTFTRRQLGADYILAIGYTEGPVIATISSGLFSDDTAFGGMFRVGTLTNAARQMPIDLCDTPLPQHAKRWTVTL